MIPFSSSLIQWLSSALHTHLSFLITPSLRDSVSYTRGQQLHHNPI